MTRLALRAGAVLLASGVLVLPAAAADVADLVPENSILFVGTDELGVVWDRAMQTRLRRAWDAEPVKEAREQVDEFWRMAMTEVTGGAAEGMEKIPWPTGQVAMAVAPFRNVESGMFEPSVLLMADFGTNAPAIEALMARAMDAMEEEGGVERIDLLGREVFVLADPMAGDDEEEDFDDPFADFDDVANPLDAAFAEVVVVREGTWVIASNHRDQVAAVLAAIDAGEPRGFAAREDVAAVAGLLGDGNGEAAVRGMFLVRDLASMMGAVDPSGMSMMFGPMIGQYLGNIDGVGFSMDMGREAMMDQRLAIWMPFGKGGLMRLVDRGAPRASVPSFVPSDALAYATMNVDVPGVGPLAQQLAGMAGMFMGGMGGPDMQEINRVITEVTGAFGRRMHVISYEGGDADGGAVRQVMAMETQRAETLDNYLSQYGAGMGMEARDFAGSRLFTMDLGGMMPAGPGGMVPGLPMGDGGSMSVGLGGGLAFMGGTPGVERMLRALGDEQAGGIEQNASFVRIAGYLEGDDIVGWGWSDTPRQIAAQVRTTISQMKAQQAEMREMLEAMGEDPGMVDDVDMMMGPMGDMFEFLEGMDAKTLGEVFGPGAWTVRTTPAGFVMRTLVTESRAD